MLKTILTLSALMLLCAPSLANIADNSKAVILAYHRIGEPQYPQSNLSSAQFDTHIKEILSGDYNVLPLPTIINAIKQEQPLPTRTIAITFEWGYASAHKNAISKLIKHDIPFTVFIKTNTKKSANYIDWKTLKKLSKNKQVSFGIIPYDMHQISNMQPAKITRQINKSRITFKEKMGFEARYASYPYGQNRYGDLDRFRMITNTAPIPTTDQEPKDWTLTAPLKQIGFTVPENLIAQIKNISCHISGQSKPAIEILENRIEVIPNEAITENRTRLNCTLPNHNGDQKQWRWLGIIFHAKIN